MTKEYKLPEYDLKVTALEVGYLVACISAEHIERMETEMPRLYKKILDLIESFYK